MCTHLQKRDGRYYFRRRVPLDLVPLLCKTEISKALGTSNRAEAIRLCRAESLSTDEQFASLRSSKRSDPPAPDPVSSKVQSILAADAPEPIPHWAVPPEYTGPTYYDEEYERIQQLIADARDEGVDEDALIAEENAILQRMYIEREALRRLKAEEAAMPQAIHQAIERPQRRPASKSALYLPALIDAWAKERTPDARTVRKAELVARRFRAMVDLIPVPSIERRHAIAFKDALLASGQSASNTNKQLELLSVLLNFACANEMTETNAAQGIRVLVKKGAKAKARISFSLPALQAIFSSPVYAEDFRTAGGAGEAAYWLPLLGLLTGARLEELCQLAPDDVSEETYLDATGTRRTVWCMRFVHNEERGQGVKNAGSVRRIPIHPDLLALGFVEYAHNHKGKPRIFPHLKPNKYGEESAQWSKWFGKYLRGPCGVTDERMVFHSFRHGFKDVCRECSIGKDLADAIQGHDDGDASSDYGGEFYPLRPLVEAMSRFRIHDLTIPGLNATLLPALQF
ncbi:hypothetical protein B0G76_0245 [Paraburkholderia sp. BL23I1N1]|uniref:site-specific integrase n=1 Tax=Paraburkholderia sp. BL23I1N1 TaxID=1938802 RepID=UPI000E714592|nr:site-specific integrase [Paraburkholderia sp. BL23I1N1]RKE34249.1 hypothetical protein B0G76_0245 [Paraburkholderia sp. BL23I1N1]